MGKRLFIDLEKCTDCAKCEVQCAYFYRPKATDHGALALRELANFAIFCRRCEDASCVAACRFEALERQEDGVLKRYNLRCVSCKCCSHACPFGTILPDTLPFYVTNCDFCLQKEGVEPPCVVSCVNKAIEYREVAESAKEGIFIVNDWLAVHSPRWDKKAV
ncbi:MAG: 4Fe-4S ferredoxin [Verrucomicrobia bacterium]|nr:4Fe-4S ferredoxin [Verrucomicrobiota bacterium]MBU1909020.1 4Fe-4S ferredoxin [Verrucomicrobiota bacterium]